MKSDLKRLDAMGDEDIDTTDIPELDEAFFRDARVVVPPGKEQLITRLVEKWIVEDLSEEELAILPEELKQRACAHFRGLVDEALEDVKAGRVIDGPIALARIRERLRERQG